LSVYYRRLEKEQKEEDKVMATAVIPVDSKKFEATQSELQKMVSSIVVKDAETCLQAKTAQRDIRTEMKLRHAVLDPFVIRAKTNYDDAKTERDKWIAPLESMDETLAGKVKEYDRLERERTLREQEEINRKKREAEAKAADEQRKRDEAAAAERRKAEQKAIEEARKAGELNKREAEKAKKEAEERERQAKEQAARNAAAEKANFRPVEVKPNIPTVQGVPNRVNYKAEVEQPNVLINAFLDAVHLKDTERAVYLRQFITVDAQKLGEEARRVKNSKQLAALIPGVRFYED
jgi:chromatin remodeling complex protein RSC6